MKRNRLKLKCLIPKIDNGLIIESVKKNIDNIEEKDDSVKCCFHDLLVHIERIKFSGTKRDIASKSDCEVNKYAYEIICIS
jgi:hypothetical protein